MRWTPGGESEDIEDRRDDGGGGGFGGTGIGGVHLGLGGTLLLLVLSFVFRTNLFTLFSGGGPAAAPAVSNTARDAAPDKETQFISFVLDDVQKTWTTLLPDQTGVPYRHAKLVLFRDSTPSACGQAQAATGPFYCPGDEKVYIDLGFFEELKNRFGAPGEFAQAYVIAHELGHHVQKILGIEQKARRLEQGANANAVSVKIELQADCFAGVWGKSSEQRDVIDQSDIKQGLAAAAAVGDDRLQKMATGHISPETFTHGSSAQRTQWFERGLEGGKVSSCDTFAAQ